LDQSSLKHLPDRYLIVHHQYFHRAA